MKFSVTFKTPDALEYAVDDVIDCLVPEDDERFEDEFQGDEDAWRDATRDELITLAGKWMRYGETITIEFDRDAGSAVVLENPT